MNIKFDKLKNFLRVLSLTPSLTVLSLLFSKNKRGFLCLLLDKNVQ